MVTLIQMDIQWSQSQANRQAAETIIVSAPGSDLYVLPEMWDTGFLADGGHSVGETADTLRWMQRMADRTDAAIAGSMATWVDGTWRNRFYFVMPGGKVSFYDKHHLFTYSGEDKLFAPGEERVIVEWRGIRYLLQVCYDLRFPVYSRNRLLPSGEAEYDCILYVASWPSSRRQVWDILLRARAIENQCYVLGVNRVGSDPTCQYNGGTAAIDAYGRVMSVAPDEVPGIITAAPDTDKLRAFRQKFPVLRDADAVVSECPC